VTPPICSLGAQPLPLGVVRAILSRSSDKITPVHKYYYSGPMFRYERPQKGRLRQVCVCLSIVWMHTEHVSPQFNQFGVELIGSAGWVADIEMITMASHFLDAIGLGGVVEVLDKSFFRVIACCTSSRSTRSEIARAGRRTETCSSTTCGRCGASSRQTACKGKKNIVFSLIFFLDDCADSTRVTPSACSIPSRRRIKHSCPRRPPYTTI